MKLQRCRRLVLAGRLVGDERRALERAKEGRRVDIDEDRAVLRDNALVVDILALDKPAEEDDVAPLEAENDELAAKINFNDLIRLVEQPDYLRERSARDYERRVELGVRRILELAGLFADREPGSCRIRPR